MNLQQKIASNHASMKESLSQMKQAINRLKALFSKFQEEVKG